MKYLGFAYPTWSLPGRNAAASAKESSGAGPRAASLCSAILVTKASRVARVSKPSLAPKTRLAKPLCGAGGGVEHVVLGSVGRSGGSESVVSLVDLRAGHVRASFRLLKIYITYCQNLRREDEATHLR